MRKTFIQTIVAEARRDKRIFLITPDIGYSVLEPFMHEFPDRYLNVGVAEQNAVSIAAGLSMKGFIPFVYTIMPFVTMRPYEQIRVDVAYMNNNVRLVGVGAGFSYGAAGATHHSTEDIAILRCLPNMTIICPGDPWETEMAVKSTLAIKGPVYIRLGKQGEPILHKPGTTFEIGKGIFLRKGNDFNLLTTSNTLEMACLVWDALLKRGKKGNLISMHTIKPLDQNLVLSLLKNHKPMFTLEEHFLIGGLGSAVAEIIAESAFNPVFKRFGVPDKFSHFVGNHDFIRGKMGLTVPKISSQIIKLI